MVREADAVGDPPGVADLPRLELCLRAFKEALRLYPPVYVFGRDSEADGNIGGYELPGAHEHPRRRRGCSTTRRASGPTPSASIRTGFLPETEAARHRYAYLPFGAGPRICLGNHFAYMEAQLALAVLLRRYDFELLGDDEPEPSATLRPKHGVRVRVRARTRARAVVPEGRGATTGEPPNL